MANHIIADADLEVVARACLLGSRQDRLDFLNRVRGLQGLAAITTGISVTARPAPAALATAFSNLSAAATGA